MSNIKSIDELKNLNFKNNDVIILDPKHNLFEKDLKMAFHYGFQHPIIRTEKNIKNQYILLSKSSYPNYNNDKNDKNNYHISSLKRINLNNYEQFLRNIDFALKNYKSSDKICTNYIVLTKDTIKYLEYYSKKLKVKTKNGNMEQREISGTFDVYPISDNMLEVNINPETLDTGELENVNHKNTVGSFHTHPFDAYVKYNVCMAFPSADDYFTTLHIYASGYGAFHITSTLEGIYIITMKKRFMTKNKQEILDNFQKYKEDIEDKYGVDYPICDPKKDNKKFWKSYIKKYLKKINRLKYFNLQFVFWENAHNPIKINYEKINGNCLISDEQIYINNKTERSFQNII